MLSALRVDEDGSELSAAVHVVEYAYGRVIRIRIVEIAKTERVPEFVSEHRGEPADVAILDRSLWYDRELGYNLTVLYDDLVVFAEPRVERRNIVGTVAEYVGLQICPGMYHDYRVEVAQPDGVSVRLQRVVAGCYSVLHELHERLDRPLAPFARAVVGQV